MWGRYSEDVWGDAWGDAWGDELLQLLGEGAVRGSCPISPLYLPHISPTSRPYLAHISAISPLYLLQLLREGAVGRQLGAREHARDHPHDHLGDIAEM